MADHVSIINPPRAVAPAATPAADRVVADGWWPEISIAEFRSLHRLTPEISEPRVRAALRTGMQAALIDLGAWGVSQRLLGHATLADVPTFEIDGVSHYTLCWTRAVMALAKCEIAETHRDYDATGSGERNSNFLDDSIHQLRRDAQNAIRDLKGTSRTFVKLI
jgi:hypothetical protein